jgi:translation initiation factor 1A
MVYEDYEEGSESEVTRVRMPKGRETIGIVDEMLGAGRFRVRCLDKKNRLCRVSGKFKKKQWIRPGDVVLVEPWEVESDEKGDIIWKYRTAEVEWMKKKGVIKDLI